jgi:hypothetical protein
MAAVEQEDKHEMVSLQIFVIPTLDSMLSSVSADFVSVVHQRFHLKRFLAVIVGS